MGRPRLLGPYLRLAQSLLHAHRTIAGGLLRRRLVDMTWEAIDDNALAPAASPPPACQPSTLLRGLRNPTETVCQALPQHHAPKRARRTIDGPRRTSLCSWACAHTSQWLVRCPSIGCVP